MRTPSWAGFSLALPNHILPPARTLASLTLAADEVHLVLLTVVDLECRRRLSLLVYGPDDETLFLDLPGMLEQAVLLLDRDPLLDDNVVGVFL